MDHQGDGNSLLHQVASFVPATLKCSFGTTAPLLRDGEGSFHSLELVLTAINEIRGGNASYNGRIDQYVLVSQLTTM
jgi:hypothetical protein